MEKKAETNRSHDTQAREWKPIWNSRRDVVTFFALAAIGILSLLLPIPYFFGETVYVTAFFFFLALLMYGPVVSMVLSVIVFLIVLPYVNNDLQMLFMLVHFLLSMLAWLMFKRHLLISELALWLVIGVPAFVLASLLGFITDAQHLTMMFCVELSATLLSAVAADVMQQYGFLERILGVDPRNRHHQRIPVQQMLLHVTFGPLLAGVFLFMLVSGRTAEARIVHQANTVLSAMENGVRTEMAGWSITDQMALQMGSAVQKSRMERAFVDMESTLSATLMLFDHQGNLRATIHEEILPKGLDVADAQAYTMENGLQMLSRNGSDSGMNRLWRQAVFARTFQVQRQTVAVMIPVQTLDNYIGAQMQMLLTAGPFMLLAMVLLILVSRRLERSLNHLADGTTRLLANLAGDNSKAIPLSGVMEVDALAENFLFMNTTLEDMFQELQTVNDDLIAQSDKLRLSEAEMFRLAHFDVLTQLPNRHYLRTRVQAIMETHPVERFAMMLVDLDKFKPVNDRYGHHIGDLVLQEVGERFRRVIGDEVTSGDFSARLGGDEFVSIVTGDTPEDLRNKANALVEALATPIRVAEVDIRIASSIGISCWPADGNDLGTLLKKADMAMYHAKQLGGNAWAEFDERHTDEASFQPHEDVAWKTAEESDMTTGVETAGETVEMGDTEEVGEAEETVGMGDTEEVGEAE